MGRYLVEQSLEGLWQAKKINDTRCLDQNHLKISRKQQVKVNDSFLCSGCYILIIMYNINKRLLCETLDNIVVMF